MRLIHISAWMESDLGPLFVLAKTSTTSAEMQDTYWNLSLK